MKPKVILYNAVSLDGRINNFPVDLGQYYSLAAVWKEDVSLVGSNTILESTSTIPVEGDEPIQKTTKKADKRPLLVVVDSQGRVKIWDYLLKQPYWREGISLCSKKTPQEHLAYLKNKGIEYIIAGEEKIDLRKAIQTLNKKYKTKTIRVDGGGILNGALLMEGLVDEVSVLIHPALVGGPNPRTINNTPTISDKPIKLNLISCEKQRGGLYWMRYKVIKK
jgi:2,5-diamino-6-(ribosylamino)-4(3H)-pyrimidinone 5'-phosphate reductase